MMCTKSKLWLTALNENASCKDEGKEKEILDKVKNYLEQQDQFENVSELDDLEKAENEFHLKESTNGDKKAIDDNENYGKEEIKDFLEDKAVTEGTEQQERLMQSTAVKGYNFNDNPDDDYDTDLECEEDAVKSYAEEQKERYLTKCRKLRIPPSSILLTSLTKKRLKLSHQGLGSKGIQAVATMLRSNTFINELDLRDNNLDEAAIRIIAKTFRESLFISDLDISENSICNAGLSEFIEVIKVSKTIKSLKMSQTGLKDRHSGMISDMIKENMFITTLVLSKNEFGAFAGTLIGQALTNNNKISRLDLSWNQIRNEGAVAIGQGLKCNTSMTHLDLAWNGFADKGTEAVAKALLTNDCIEELDLSYNRISEKGAASMADALKVNYLLRILKMNWNPVKSEGVTSLIAGINKNENSEIKELHLNGVVINSNCRVELDDLLIKRKTLKVFHGGVTSSGAMSTNMNKIRREIVEIITKYLAKNRLRMLDLFNQWDKDKSLTLTRNEFRKGIKSCKIPITEMQLYFMLEWLDQDGNDEIEYNEFVAITEVE